MKIVLRIYLICLMFQITGYVSAQPSNIRNYAETIPDSALYLGQTPPGNTPKIFNLSVSPGFFAAERIAISNDGTEIYYSELDGYFHLARIKHYIYSGGKWNGPDTLFENFFSPALSVDGKTMYFQSIAQTNNQIWYSVKSNTGWSSPSRFLPNQPLQYLLQETNSENYYFSSTNSNGSLGGKDYSKLIVNSADTILQSLGLPLCTRGDDLDFSVSKDESCMIISLGSNSSALLISYRKADNTWTNPKNLGQLANTGTYQWGPYITNDNRYLFFSRYPALQNNRIYWMRIDNLIESLKHTNFIPYVINPIHNQTASKDSLFKYQIPDNTFIDDDGNNTLTYSATLSNGSSLPAWLSFNSATQMFSGTPDTVATLTIKITATDTANASASCQFKITVVTGSTGVKEDAADSINLSKLVKGKIQ